MFDFIEGKISSRYIDSDDFELPLTDDNMSGDEDKNSNEDNDNEGGEKYYFSIHVHDSYDIVGSNNQYPSGFVRIIVDDENVDNEANDTHLIAPKVG